MIARIAHLFGRHHPGRGYKLEFNGADFIARCRFCKLDISRDIEGKWHPATAPSKPSLVMATTLLPFKPEPVEQLVARFKDALRDVYTDNQVLRGELISPGVQRKHVFDFATGLRMIVSIERHSAKRHFAHFSFGAPIGSTIFVHSDETLQGHAREILKLFWEPRMEDANSTEMTDKAWHVFFLIPT